MLLKGSFLQLLKALGGGEITLDWATLDPILALQAVAAESDPLPIELAFEGQKRWLEYDGSPELSDQAIDKSLKLNPGDQFRLIVDGESSPAQPIVIGYRFAPETQTKDGQAIRAQLLPKAKRMDFGEGPWRVSDRLNTPLKVSAHLGRYGLCAISGAGCSEEFLFGETLTNGRLDNAHLQHLVKRLLEAYGTDATLKVALLSYEVV